MIRSKGSGVNDVVVDYDVGACEVTQKSSSACF